MPEPRKTVFTVLRHPTFALILAAAAVSNIGNWMEGVAQAWAVVEQSKETPAQSAFLSEILSVADFSPVLFLALIAGVIADRVNRKHWLILLQISACLLGAGLAVLGYMNLLTPWRVIAFTFAEGVVWALNGPVWMSVVPMLVPRDELEYATAANSMQFNLARLVGPALAGFVIHVAGANLAFAINALTFIPVLLALTQLPSSAVVSKPATEKSAGILEDLTSGLRFVWNHRGARRLALMSMTFTFLSAPVQGLLAVFARQVLGGGSTLYGAMLAMIGMGSLIGAVTLGRIPPYYPRHHLIPLSMCLFAAFGLLYSFSHVVWMTLPLLLMCGVFWLMTLNPLNTATQLLAPDEQRGRIMSVMLVCSQGAMPIGHLVAGLLAHVLAPELIVRVMLAVLLVVAIGFLFRREPEIDQLQHRTVRSASLLARVREAITAESHAHPHAPDPTDSVRIPRPGNLT